MTDKIQLAYLHDVNKIQLDGDMTFDNICFCKKWFTSFMAGNILRDFKVKLSFLRQSRSLKHDTFSKESEF